MLVTTASACLPTREDPDGSEGTGQYQTEAKATLPLHEVSGLAVRGKRYVAIGDRSTDVVTFGVLGERLVNIERHKPTPRAGHRGSQWEAVTFDGRGQAVVMAETGELSILRADCEEETGSTKLDWDSAEHLLEARIDRNSLGEGLVVLSKTHVLVALEKSPTALIEFGPKGATALGYEPGSPTAEAFDPPSELVALKAWRVDEPLAPDLSELIIGPDGALWAISQQGGTLVRFEKKLRADEKRASLHEYLPLPRSVGAAEGLAFDGNRPIVARDRSAEATNIFMLTPLEVR